MLREDSTERVYCSSACATARYRGRSSSSQDTTADTADMEGDPGPVAAGSSCRPGKRSSCRYTALG